MSCSSDSSIPGPLNLFFMVTAIVLTVFGGLVHGAMYMDPLGLENFGAKAL